MAEALPRRLVVLLKGYPRLSETFIAQEILGLERAGFDLVLVSMRHPTDPKRHPIHDEIRAPVLYLPEYLHDEPLRVLRAFLKGRRLPGFRRSLGAFLADLRRDPTRNRIRRYGQALVLATEWPAGGEWLHSHFIHTPASVAGYTGLLTGRSWSCSAHAKDIWTSPAWDLAGKLAGMRWAVTCTRAGAEHLRALAGPGADRVHLSYHGLDLHRFAAFDERRPPRDGSDPADPVRILSVGRAVDKKGYDLLLQALALLPPGLNWRFEHVGGGPLLAKLHQLSRSLGLEHRTSWSGPLDQAEVLARYRAADLFALACRVSADGDRDGLPNVLVEAASQRLACVSTDVPGVTELICDGENGLVVAKEDPAALAGALARAIAEPVLRERLGTAVEARVRGAFDHRVSIGQLTALFRGVWQDAA